MASTRGWGNNRGYQQFFGVLVIIVLLQTWTTTRWWEKVSEGSSLLKGPLPIDSPTGGQLQHTDNVYPKAKPVVHSKSSKDVKEMSKKNYGIMAAATVTPQDPDRDCIFRNSSLYRSVYVYPSPGEEDWISNIGNILSTEGQGFPSFFRYPWQIINARTKEKAEYHYRIRDSRAVQYTTELLVYQILANSCLRTHDPEQAKLFYVPYLASVEWHNGTQYPKSFDTSPYGQAILDLIEGDKNEPSTTAWEREFGWTLKYWNRRQGADHILVMSEACHGLWHPRSLAGNDVFIRAQQQLAPPIIIFKDVSLTFVNQYPNCARKNIMVPQPQTDGRWFNGRVDMVAKQIAQNASFDKSPIRLSNDPLQRPLPYYYKAGSHGTCRTLRISLQQDFDCASPTNTFLKKQKALLPNGYHFPHAYRHSTFCPCPGGDTPSAKRMFDAIFAGCIPLILSADFVWPLTNEMPGSLGWLNPQDFSIRLNSSDFRLPYNPCEGDNSQNESSPQRIQTYVEGIPMKEVTRLQKGLQHAARIYAYYVPSNEVPDNPLRDNYMPNGPAAHALVQALEERAEGRLWPACRDELKEKDPSKDNVHIFRC